MKITTSVACAPQYVWENFGESLFQKLVPPFPKARLLEFGGNEKGARVAIELNFLLFKQKWVSDITDNGREGDGFYFVDEGSELPFFIKKWKHRHVIVEGENGGAKIIDDVSFQSHGKLMTWFFTPLIWLQFVYRKPIYKRVFGEKAKATSSPR
ncbi:hypothetical protein R9C00_20580 [Flammeovirgaceae bacterium SG7u.111]|nr:hypothetical protein [Flammeovirgaceae bacterium SG7u.132]WPO34099.1 hypothetical protein R9C00_20580 [Flammeovirgaceae bacterium SG7u.111]